MLANSNADDARGTAGAALMMNEQDGIFEHGVNIRGV
jgi:hypothetical protein